MELYKEEEQQRVKSNLKITEEVNYVNKQISNKIYSAEISKDKFLYRFIKRALDIVFSLLIIIGLLPIYILIALKIKIDDGGKIFYKHKRIGKDNQEFGMYKFRTMVLDAEEKLKELLDNDPELKQEFYKNFKLKNDPRITEIGHYLRRTSLDELPQLFNVLKGDMSLVGPRPVVKKELDLYYKELGRIIFSMKPGVTGMWQAYLRSDYDNYQQRIRLDLYYLKNRSILLDLKILFKTIVTVLKRQGAY